VPELLSFSNSALSWITEVTTLRTPLVARINS